MTSFRFHGLVGLISLFALTFLLPSGLFLLGSATAQERLFEGDQIPPKVEAMYKRGINFLNEIAQDDGSFGGDHYGSQSGVIGICVIAMLAHGEDPNYGPYSKAIKRGVGKIIEDANKSNGYLGNSMYNHGFATLALAEAYGHVMDNRIGPALRKACDLIITAQKKSARGGWRYSPETSDSDSTVSGAQMVALLAARNAGLEIPDAAIKRGLEYLKSCQGGDGGIGYTRAGGGNVPRTAIAATTYALAKKKDDDVWKAAFKFLKQAGYSNGSYTYYSLYYNSQAFFHGDMEGWGVWNKENIQWLQDMQAPDGSWNGQHGITFSTGSALLSLALNYRLLPIYER